MQLETTKDNKPVIDAGGGGGGGVKVLAVVTNGDESGEKASAAAAVEEALQVMLMRVREFPVAITLCTSLRFASVRFGSALRQNGLNGHRE